jgi:DNA-binding response OmpR family regulator
LFPGCHLRSGTLDEDGHGVTGPVRADCDRDDPDMRVLVAEDDEVLARAVAVGLRREGMAVDIALDGDDARTRLAINDYDVVVLDRDLPGTHGDQICRALAAEGSASRVLMLTAASSVGDRVEGLGLGADDYLPKPFEFAELVARIRAVARRPAMPPADLAYRDLSLDPVGRVAFRGGLRLDLSRKELAVLECLLAARGRPVSAEELLERVWDDEVDPFTATVKTTISRLRAKLGEPPLIETIRESGYRIGGP